MIGVFFEAAQILWEPAKFRRNWTKNFSLGLITFSGSELPFHFSVIVGLPFSKIRQFFPPEPDQISQ